MGSQPDDRPSPINLLETADQSGSGHDGLAFGQSVITPLVDLHDMSGEVARWGSQNTDHDRFQVGIGDVHFPE